MIRRYQQTTALLCLLLGATALPAEEHQLLAIVEANFKAADANGDGNLDSVEFPSLINANAEHDIGRSTMVKRFGAYQRAFNTADKNGDGMVAWSEILSVQAH